MKIIQTTFQEDDAVQMQELKRIDKTEYGLMILEAVHIIKLKMLRLITMTLRILTSLLTNLTGELGMIV
jgi:hypothetical protein